MERYACRVKIKIVSLSIEKCLGRRPSEIEWRLEKALLEIDTLKGIIEKERTARINEHQNLRDNFASSMQKEREKRVKITSRLNSKLNSAILYLLLTYKDELNKIPNVSEKEIKDFIEKQPNWLNEIEERISLCRKDPENIEDD